MKSIKPYLSIFWRATRSFFRDWYYDICRWLIEQKLQTIDFAVWVLSKILWGSIAYREEFYEYRKQNWRKLGAKPDFQQFIRYKFFGG